MTKQTAEMALTDTRAYQQVKANMARDDGGRSHCISEPDSYTWNLHRYTPYLDQCNKGVLPIFTDCLILKGSPTGTEVFSYEDADPNATMMFRRGTTLYVFLHVDDCRRPYIYKHRVRCLTAYTPEGA